MGMSLLYGFPYISKGYRISVEPHTIPIILPLTQVALTGNLSQPNINTTNLILTSVRFYMILLPKQKTSS